MTEKPGCCLAAAALTVSTGCATLMNPGPAPSGPPATSDDLEAGR